MTSRNSRAVTGRDQRSPSVFMRSPCLASGGIYAGRGNTAGASPAAHRAGSVPLATALVLVGGVLLLVLAQDRLGPRGVVAVDPNLRPQARHVAEAGAEVVADHLGADALVGQRLLPDVGL